MKFIARFLRTITPIPLRRVIRKIGFFFGCGIDAHTQFPSVEGAMHTLRQMGFNPAFCVDVGAYHGEWAKMFKIIFPASKILMIEAQDAKRPILEQVVACHKSDISMEILLLGPADGQIVRFSEMETGSSVYAETSIHPRVIREKATQQLDTILRNGEYPAVDILKLDVQGYELQILRGASATLHQASAVLLEASLIPINIGCPLIAEVIAFMDSSGFQLFDFCGQIRLNDGVLWQTDLLFLRKGSQIFQGVSHKYKPSDSV